MITLKRILILSLAIVLMSGMTGCMKDYSEERENTRRAMLKYINEAYEQDFTEFEFRPAPRGFNDGMNESILVVKSPEGFFVKVRETVQSKGKFYDDYINALASWYFNKGIDYSKVTGLSFAMIRFTLLEDISASQLQKLKEGDLSSIAEKRGSISCMIAMRTPLKESNLEEVYGIYQQLEATNRKFNLRIAFSAYDKKSEYYIMTYPLDTSKTWRDFVPSISHYAGIVDSGLSFDEFSDQIINWKDTR